MLTGGTVDSGNTIDNGARDASRSDTDVLTATDFDFSPFSGIAFSSFQIQFTIDQGNSSGFAFTSFTIANAASPDSTNPSFDSSNSTPNDNATGVATANDIVVDFDEDIVAGTGNFTLKLVGGATVETFDIATATATTTPGAGAVGITGDKVYLNPTSNLAESTSYAIQIDSTAIDDNAGNSFVGISDDTTFNFTTADETAPTFNSAGSTPNDDTTGVATANDIVVDFSENIAGGTGNITLKLVGGATVETFDITGATTTTTPGAGALGISGDKLYINPTAALTESTAYAIQIAGTAIDDTSGNSFAGIGDDTTFNFTTADETAPTFNSAGSTPNDDATGVATANDIVVDFSENIAGGTGNITLKLVGGATVETFDITGATATTTPGAGALGISGDKLYINPTAALTESTAYAVQIASTAIDDTSGNSFAGISDDTTFNFQTQVPPPTVTLSRSEATVTEAATSTSTITATLSASASADATITIAVKSGSSATLGSDFSLSTTSITITAGNTTGTSTLTAINDSIDDDGESVTIEITGVSGGDSATEDGTQEVSISITDNDAAGFSIVESSGATNTSESGTTDSFTVQLDSEPTSNVVFDVSSADTGEATVSPASLTFTNANWNTPQTVTVTGVDDSIIDGTQSFNVTLAVNDASSDNTYDPLSNQTVSVDNSDNDVAGFTVTESSSSTATTEAGGTDSFTVVLDAEPNSNVVIDVTSADTGEATVSTSSLTFTTANWDTPQTVTVTGVDDNIIDGTQTFNVTLAIDAASTDDNFDAVSNQTVSVDNSDNEVAGFTVTESSSSTATTEAGGTDSFTVVLDAEPNSNVVIDVTSADTGEATVSTSSLTFTTANWDTPQTVTVTGVDDNIIDGTQTFNVTLAIDAASTDDNFDAVSNQTVSVDNSDNEVAGFTVTESSSSTATTEAGGTDSFTVALDAEPNSNVVIDVTSADTGEATVSTSSLTFTTANWDTPQTVTVTGVDDNIIDGTQTFNVTLAIDAASSDDNFDALSNQTVSVDNTDNDTAGFSIVESSSSTATTEAGGTDSFTVVLDAEPDSNVVINVTSGDTGEATVSTSSLTFTTANWNTPQTVTVTGVDDDIIDGTQSFNITMAIDAASSDDNFDALSDQTVSVDNSDDDVAGYTITESSSSTDTTEAGGTDSFTVALDAEPNSDVVINVTSGDTGEATVSASSLTFTNANWNTPQTVTVTGVDDDVIDGTQTFNVTTSIDIASSDDNFDALSDKTVSVDNTDDDVAGFTVTESSSSTDTTEAGGTDDFTVVLDAEPDSNVVITVTSGDTGEATVSTSSLTFTNANWNTPQTVTVTGVDDSSVDGTQTFNITMAVDDASSDNNFDSLSDQTVSVDNTDDDTATVTIADVSGNEDDGAITVTATLDVAVVGGFSVDVSTADGTATTSDSDYTPVTSQTLTFAGTAGETETFDVTPTSDSTSEGNETVSISMSNLSGAVGTVNISDTATLTILGDDNAAPVFSGLDNTPAYTEDGSAVTLDGDVSISDTELDALNSSAGNYSGATLTIARNGGANSDDEFSASGNLATLTETGALTYNSLGYGTVTTNSSGTLVLTFSDSSNIPTTAIVASIMRAITYSNGSDAPDSSVTLDWTFSDGAASSTGTNQVTISVTAENDAPVLDATQSPALTAINEDVVDGDNSGTNVAAVVVDSSMTDPDGSIFEAIAVTAVDNSNGVWQYSTDSGTSWNNFSDTTGQSVSLTTASRLLEGVTVAGRTAQGATANIGGGGSDHKVRFVPNANYNGSATMTYRAWDRTSGTAGSTADTTTNGGTTAFSSQSDTASITVNSVNDDPSVDTNDGVTVERGSSITIGSSVLSTSDVEDSAANVTYTVTAVPTVGALQLSNTSLSVNDTFTQDDIDNDNLTYVHAGAVNTSDSFTFSVADQNSGSLTGQTFNITIQDTTAPTITAVSIPNSTHKVGDTVTVTMTVSSDSDDYTTGSGGISGTVAGYSLGSLSRVSDTQYTASFTISDGGTDVAAGSNVSVSVVLTDSSGNSNSAFTTAISQASDAIYANLPEVVLAVDKTTITEDGSTANGVATITASLTGSLNNMWPEDVGIDISFGGTATLTSDYTRSTTSLTISAESLSDSLTVTSVADSIFDALSDETVTVDINCIVTSSVSAASGQTKTITITDAQSAPTVALSVDNTEIPEDGSSSATATATLSTATFENVVIDLAYSGTATSNDDYNVFASNSMTITAGQTTVSVGNPVTATQDTDSEGDETVIIDIDSVSGGGATEDTAQQVTITIQDDDNTAPVFSSLGGTADFTEDGSAVTLDNDVTITDSENDAENSSSGNYTNSTLTLARNGGADSNDTFAVVSGSQMAVSGSDITDSIGDKFASFSSSSGTLTVTFSGDLTTPTTALVNEVLQNITYENTSEDPTTSVQLNWTFSDSQLSSSGSSDTTTVTIATVNDAPTLDDSQSPILTTLLEDVADGDNSGDSVASIVVDSSIDNIEAAQTTESIVVTSVDNSNGVWQYTTDGGTNWNDFSSTTGSSVDLTSTTEARLLSSSSTNNKIRFVPDEHANGTATFTFRAWDEDTGSNGSTADVSSTGGDTAFSSNTDTASVSITAVNDAPAIGTNNGLTVDEGGTGVITTSVLADSDPDDTGTELTFTVTTTVTNGTLFLDADGDDTADSAETLSANSTFTQADLSNGDVQYTHDGGETTSDSFEFSLADGGEDEVSELTGQTFNITVTSVNETPVITSTEVTSATEDSAYSYTITAIDVDAGDSLTYAAPTLPSWLSLDSSSGVLSGTPENDDVGSHSVVLTVTDTGNLSATQSFTITVANTNDAPVISSTAVTAASEDSAYSYTLTVTDVDDGDSVTLAATTLPDWLSFSSGTGVLTGTPTNNEVGSHSVTLTATDNSNATDIQSFTIIVANTNDAPVINSTAITSVNEDSAYSYTLTATDVDDGDTLTLAAPTLPDWLSFDSSTGTLSGTPVNSNVGFHAVVLTATDTSNAVDTQSFTITVANTNDAPVINSTAITSVNEDSIYSYTLAVTEVDNGDIVSLAATTLPSWLSFDSSTGTLSGTPLNSDVGSHPVVLTATDTSNAVDTQSFTITVANTNDAPVINSTAITSVNEDSIYSYTLAVTEVDNGDTVSLAATTLPSWLSFDSSTGILSGTPLNSDVGSHPVVLTATDTSNAVDTQSFTITVVNTNDAPIISGTPATEVAVGDNYSFVPGASDDDNDSLSFSSTNLPSFLQLSPSNGEISGTPGREDIGTYTDIVVSVSDGTVTSSLAGFTLTVVDSNEAPVIEQGESITVNMSEDGSPTAFALSLSATDVNDDSLTWSISEATLGAVSVSSSGVVNYSPEADVNGTDSFSVSVSDGILEDTIAVTVNIEAVNDAPIISGTPTTLISLGDIYSFVPTASDVDSDPLTFSIDTTPSWASFDSATGALTGTPTGNDVGTSGAIVITVSDGDASASLTAFSITVVDPNANVAPTVSDVADSTDEDVAVEVTLAGEDANGDELTYSVITAPANGEVVIAGNIATYTPSADFNGSDSFTYSANDGLLDAEEAATVTIAISAVNDAPLITGEPATQVALGSAYLFEPSASDVEGDTLTFSEENLPTWLSLNAETGVVSGTPTEEDLGTYNGIVITVSDGDLSSSLVAFNIEVIDPNVNTAPVAFDSNIETNEDTAVTFALVATDVDEDTLTFTITQMPASGTIEQDGSSVTYTPDANVSDIQDSFNFTVSDGVDTSEQATVIIDILAVNDAPEIEGTPVTSVRVGESYEFIPSTSDIENDTLTFTIENQPRWSSFDGNTGALTGVPGSTDLGTYGNVTITVSDGTDEAVLEAFNIDVLGNEVPVISGNSVSAVEVGQSYSFTPQASDPDGDSLTFSIENQPGWTAFDSETGTLSGAPQDSDIGTYAGIVISVSDGFDSVSLQAFDLEVCDVCGNVAPTISGIPGTAVTEGASYSFTPSASDINGDLLTFSIDNQPGWTSFDSATGSLTGVPGIADVGTFTGIVISVSDGELSASLTAFSITVNELNDAPVISGTPTSSIFQNDEYLFTPAASDAEGDTLTFSIINKPGWASFNNRTGTLRGTPLAANVGIYNDIVISVSDGNSSSALGAFSIEVVARNSAPVISGSPRTAITQGVSYSFTPSATDADGDSLSYSASGLPGWLSVDTTTGALSGTPNADDVGVTGTIVVTVTDGTDSASLTGFTITVTEANAIPVATDSSVTVDEDTSIAITPDVVDGDGDSLTLTVLTQPANGSLTETASGWTYTPDADFNGSDSFVYQASDGDANSENATVSITVNNVNDRPVAVVDTFNFDQNAEGIYVLDVLANDTDADIATAGDVLTLQGVDPDIGVATIVNNQVQFNPGVSFIGDVDLVYSVRDSARRSAQARVNLTINGVAGIGQPVLTVPADLTVDAEGLFTEVDLGVANATDADGNPLPVSLVRGSSNFKPGAKKVFWTTEDSFGSTTTDSQILHVNPLISLSKDKIVKEDSTVNVRVILNGDAPVYPLTVGYTVSGTATSGSDHDAQSGSVTFTSGREQSITFNVFADDEVESGETVTFALNSGQNLGANNVSVITISEENIAPEIRLTVTQGGDDRLTVAQDEGNVRITGTVTDANPQDTLNVQWSSNGLTDLSNSNNNFIFRPSDVATGIYQVTLFASDNGEPVLSNTADVFIEVVETLEVLSDTLDSDGDLIPDDQEGYADADGDGIPDYLDAIDDCNVVPEQAVTQDEFLVESEPGVCLRQGSISALNSSDGLEVIIGIDGAGRAAYNSRGERVILQAEGLPEDTEASNIGGIFDFILYNLPEEGQTASVVLPQTRPVPANAVYRKYSVRNERWGDFVINDNNQIFSARGTKGVCPPPGSSRWIAGLTEGHWCVQLQILDGGINDDDGLVNGAVSDPGGVAVVLAGNSLPDIQDDSASMQWNTTIEIDVLANDSDDDGDSLSVESVDGSFGTADITATDTIMYTPDNGFVGTEVLTYAVSDGNGGTGSAQVTITINGNRAPGARSDSASTTDDVAIEIDVLANDIDIDGDELIIRSADVDFGTVSITAGNTLLYTPMSGFDGLATITYVVSDSFGATSTATVSVVVDGNQAPQALDDTVSTEFETSVTIAVLDNDMDIDGDELSVVSANASSGSVVVNSNNTLTFTPASNFSGTVTITYTISDGELTDEGRVTVTVAAEPVEVVTVNNKSGGGAINAFWLLVLLMVAWRRKVIAEMVNSIRRR
ncbi:putative Ig domain-containing protein [Planctobacterium marinum]|uniref:Cadherin domain-containing protein n=1 Tax=Planctobacterium marinum TaxID=1631968 RepID=A0AA48KQL1_9ALTE|nr:hypothetical protein MACH26_34120 [Planctobacterium marinum]